MNYQEFAGKIKQKYPQYGDMDDRTLAQKMVSKFPQYSDVTFDQPSSFQEVSDLKGKPLKSQIWQGLQVPEKMATRGLNSIASAMPNNVTGSLPRDLAVNTPRLMTETMAKVAPGFVSRGAMLAAGAAPALKLAGKVAAPIGRGIATGLEDWAGIKPSGSLREAAKDASLIFAKGKDAAGKFYKAEPAMGESNLFAGMYKPEQIVDAAKDYISKGGKLEPSEGLMYRKAVDSLMKSGRYVKDELMAMRQEADGFAKASENISEGDRVARRGMMANALRSFSPKNLGGKSSPFKVGEALALAHMGPLGKVAGLALSPAALGTAATGLGAAGRLAADPRSAMAVLQLIRTMKKKQEEQGQ